MILEICEELEDLLTPYKDAPALNVFLNASAAKVVYPPAELPVIHNLRPSTFPLSTWLKKVILIVINIV